VGGFFRFRVSGSLAFDFLCWQINGGKLMVERMVSERKEHSGAGMFPWLARPEVRAGRKPSRHVTASSWEGIFVFGFRVFRFRFSFFVLEFSEWSKVSAVFERNVPVRE
jgi:hypothetical protein